MRSVVAVISFLLVAVFGHAQEWSDKAHYDAFMKGDWAEVVRLGKLAKKSGTDYYYIRARNGYANFMLGKYLKAEREFEKALKFSSADPFSKRYGYWSSVYAGNVSTGLVKTAEMSQSEKDTFAVSRPKWLSSITVLGGYRASTSQNVVGNMPYASLYLSHQLGKRITLVHGANYLNQTRTSLITRLNSTVWQVGYLASLQIQAAKHTTIVPSFLMQYWESGQNQVYDLSASLAVRQQFGNVNLTLIGGYFQDTDTNKYMVGGSLTWFPLHNAKLYTITSGGYNLGGNSPNAFVRQTVGGQLAKRFWARTSFNWNNQVVSFEDIGLDFANNANDRLIWKWSLTPTYYVIDRLGISLTYSVESRRFYLPPISNRETPSIPGVPEISSKYNFHSFYVGLNYNF